MQLALALRTTSQLSAVSRKLPLSGLNPTALIETSLELVFLTVSVNGADSAPGSVFGKVRLAGETLSVVGAALNDVIV